MNNLNVQVPCHGSFEAGLDGLRPPSIFNTRKFHITTQCAIKAISYSVSYLSTSRRVYQVYSIKF
jgi:hypothetical protein